MILIRPFDPHDDYNFVIRSWMSSLHKFTTSRGYGHSNMTYDAFHLHQRPICEKLMARAKIHIACAEDYPAQIFGFLVEESTPIINVIHFAYTKRSFRMSGVFKKLIQQLDHSKTFYFTHESRDSAMIASKLKAVFDPLFINVEPQLFRKEDHEKTQSREIS